MEKLPISIGILSYKAHKTIDNMLSQSKDFLQHFDEVKVFFQSFSEKDKEIAEKHNIQYESRPDNAGIQGGMRWVIENLKHEHIVYLENDAALLCDVPTAIKTIKQASILIKNNTIDIMRLRSRFFPGEQFCDVEKYTKLFKPQSVHPSFNEHHKIKKTSLFMKYLRPLKAKKLLGRCLYIEEFPEKVCPHIKHNEKEDLYIVDSNSINWTNNSVMTSKKLFLELLDYADAHPVSRGVNGMPDFEKPLNCKWWKKQHFKIGVGEGIFSHIRLDR